MDVQDLWMKTQLGDNSIEAAYYVKRCELMDIESQRFACPFSPWQGGEGGRQAG